MILRFRVLIRSALILLALVSAASAEETSAQFVAGFLGSSTKVFTQQAASPRSRTSALKALFKAHMDIPLLANFTAGKAFRDASPVDQERFRELLAGYLVQAFYETIEDFAGGSFEVEPPTPPVNGYFGVKTIVREPGYPPETIIWRLRRDDNAYKIVEVVNKGVNIMVMQRDSFSAALKEGGLPRLIALLEERERIARLPD